MKVGTETVQPDVCRTIASYHAKSPGTQCVGPRFFRDPYPVLGDCAWLWTFAAYRLHSGRDLQQPIHLSDTARGMRTGVFLREQTASSHVNHSIEMMHNEEHSNRELCTDGIPTGAQRS